MTVCEGQLLQQEQVWLCCRHSGELEMFLSPPISQEKPATFTWPYTVYPGEAVTDTILLHNRAEKQEKTTFLKS